MQNGYLIGVDGGGTHMTAQVLSSKGERFLVSGGALNICGAPRETVTDNLVSILREIGERAGALDGVEAVCIGTAGNSNPDTKDFLLGILTRLLPNARAVIVSDAEIALEGALGGSPGAIIIAGTGSICYGRGSNGVLCRSGGAGYLIDDEGSGYALGRDALRAVTRALDGRGEKTVISDILSNEYSIVSLADVISFAYNNFDKKKIAALAPAVSKAYSMGDAVAGQIIGNAGLELFRMLKPVVEKLGIQRDRLSLLGGVLSGGSDVKARLRQAVSDAYPQMDVIEPLGSAANGALCIAGKIKMA